jgi:RNA polymerase sigma-70 factor (ECF subfamily)
LREALSQQPAKEKNLLSLYFVDGLRSAEIGKLYGVHAATVRRWIEQARQTLLDETRKRLRHRLRLEASEFESLMVLVQSQLDVTLTRCLRTDSERVDAEP